MAAARWLRQWRQCNIVTSATAWQRRGGGGSAAARQRGVAWRRCGGGGGGSVSGGGGSAKRGGGAQRDGGSAIAAARMLRRWRQRDVDGSLAVGRRRRQHQRRWRQRDARRRRTARWRPARLQQHGGCGGFTGTVRECANARAFVFVLGRGQRDDSADGIVVGGSNGGARCDVPRGRRRRRLYSKNSTCTVLSPTGKPITSFSMIVFLYSREST